MSVPPTRPTSWLARRIGGPVRLLIVRDAHPVREVRFDPRTALRVGSWVFVAVWLLPIAALGVVVLHARLERDTLATQVAALTVEAKRLSTNIAELERYAGLPGRGEGEGGPAATPPDAASAAGDAVDGTGTFLGTLRRRFGAVAGAVTDRVSLMRGTPSGVPVADARTSSTFGWRVNHFSGEGAEWHAGLDFPAPAGTPVRATADGIVETVATVGGYGLAVTVRNRGDYTTIYGHLQRATVVAGARVARGDVVGHVGSSGRSTGPHVHYEVRRHGQPVNPRRIPSPEPAFRTPAPAGAVKAGGAPGVPPAR
ncbi:MAG: M23 family metallopeptidase [Gemmatimonadota bacterium]